MDIPAAPPAVGRRPPVGAAIAMALYLTLAPPLFLLVPLALLLLFSRPSSTREWFWIAISTAGAGYIFWRAARTPSADSTLLTAGALFLAASFLLATVIFRRWSPVVRALVAVALSGGAILAAGSAAGLSMAAVDAQVEASLRALVPEMLGKNPPAAQLNASLNSIPTLVALFPGLLAFQALVGLGLAWRWHQRVATHPLPPDPVPFRDFRFEDPLIWGAIFTLAIVLAPVGPPADRIALSALVIWVGAYATRGLAIVATVSARWSLPVKLLGVVLAIPALPIALGTLVALGLGDTWLDLRRRAAQHGGPDSDGSNSA